MRNPSRIVIVGLGLIGGSLAAACRKKFPGARIIGVTRKRASLDFARRKKWIHEGYFSIEEAFSKMCGSSLRGVVSNDAEAILNLGIASPASGGLAMTENLVVLCTPVDTFKNLLLRLDRIAPKGTVVTDAGSVKEFICRWAGKHRWRNITYGGAHPMAGSHRQGIENADPGLFRGSTTFVTPANTKSQGSVGARRAVPLHAVLKFWKRISSRVVVFSAEEHDRITAEISHLPHFLAAALVQSVSGSAWPFAAAGFRDATRIAQGPPAVWAPIFLGNRRALGRALAGFESRVRQLKRIVQKGNSELLRKTLLRAQKRRTRMS